jgi:serine/threonine protein kinase
MARHIPFAAPVNASEKWAFDHLKEKLPEHYDLLTNVELLGNAGSTIEIDAVVIGDWAIYMIDVKGYTGTIEAGRHLWYAHGEEVENPLPKLNKNSKIFASRLRRQLGPGAHTPWIQGLAFVTGSEGSGVLIRRADEFVAAYSAEDIVSALTEEKHVPVPKVHRLRDSQKSAVLQDIGQVAAVEKRANSIGDFTKKQKLIGDNKFSVWTATFNRHGLDIPYLLKCIERSAWNDASASEEAVRELKREFRIYQELTGAAGVPYVAPLIDTGEQVVLPIKHPRGRPVSTIDIAELPLDKRLQAIRSAAIAIETIHSRGVFHGDLTGDNLYIADDLTSELLDFRPATAISSVSPNNDDALDIDACGTDISAFARLFAPWVTEDQPEEFANTTAATSITDWFSAAEQDGDASLAYLESLIVSGPLETVVSEKDSRDWQALPGAVLNQTYELVEQINRSTGWSTWRARHQLGNFDCVVRIYDSAEEQLDSAQKEFEILSRLYHPGLNRTFDMGQIQGSDMYFMSMAHLSDPTLRALIGDSTFDREAIKNVLRDVCNTLEYLHKCGLTHRNVSPDTIVVAESGAVLVDLSALPSDQTFTGDIRYKWRGVTDEGWSPYADLYSLAVAIVEAWTGDYPLTADCELAENALNTLEQFRSDAVIQATLAVIRHRPANIDGRYLKLFGLAEESDRKTELSPELIKRFSISTGYMTFLVLDMINDPRARSRNQWVLGALRSRNIPGNRTNRGSMSATVSRLKSAGIAEDHGKKIRLTTLFRKHYLSLMAD